MDFNVRRFAADAGTFLSRAVQFTEEKFGQAEKTELDAHLETLLVKADGTKHWTEKVMKQTEVLLQPNLNVRVEEFLYEKLDRKIPARANSHELLGECMIDAGHEFGAGTAYGSALIKCGEVEKELGSSEKQFIQSSAINFLTPLRNFIDGDYKTISKERRLLQVKRLDLDAAKTRMKKARSADARSAEFLCAPAPGLEYVSHFTHTLSFLHVKWLKVCSALRVKAEMELKIAQSEFDRQVEITRLLLEGISSTHAHHLRCLSDFVDAQAAHYAQCYQYMVNLQKQLGSFPSAFSSNNDRPAASTPGISVPATLPATPTPALTPGQSSPSLNELRNSCGPRRARVLYDYDAAGSTELSLLADEVITVSSEPGLDSDWLMGERGHQKGKVPITYLELLN
ncbi:endophilin-B1b isoform X2 [Trichomycterus rosablanca]|uniref:endophilin-B1b isoform X2 n=1 Tax=Trichomycterus rosablanca TaxID=2290929 RepID=UPI002F35C88E